MSKELEDELILMGKNARKASQILTLAKSEIKNNALEAMADDIEKNLIKRNTTNYQNLAGSTTIPELIGRISNLDLFITGDSGPMHVAAAFQVPTVAIFGPTKDKETSQWMNTKNAIVKKNLDCQPCMQRTCPLKHHNCMRFVNEEEVLDAVKQFNL